MNWLSFVTMAHFWSQLENTWQTVGYTPELCLIVVPMEEEENAELIVEKNHAVISIIQTALWFLNVTLWKFSSKESFLSLSFSRLFDIWLIPISRDWLDT